MNKIYILSGVDGEHFFFWNMAAVPWNSRHVLRQNRYMLLLFVGFVFLSRFSSLLGSDRIDLHPTLHREPQRNISAVKVTTVPNAQLGGHDEECEPFV